MARRERSSQGARTGQSLGRVRAQGPMVRQRRQRQATDVDVVLGELSERTRKPLVVDAELRDALFSEHLSRAETLLARRFPERLDWAHQEATVELATAAWALAQACFARQSRPVWTSSTSRLSMDFTPSGKIDLWVRDLLRLQTGLRPRDVTFQGLLTASNGRLFEGLMTLAFFCDATIDDVAVLCDRPRAEVYRVVWRMDEPPMP